MTTTHITRAQKKEIMQLMEGRSGELNGREYRFEDGVIYTHWIDNYKPATRYDLDSWDDMDDENTLDNLRWLDHEALLKALEAYHIEMDEDGLKEIEFLIASEATTI
ncbi:hypothetical protein SAMN05192529_1106 [Arachidicoccus rhizosphaerae]|uniref:Uncharacterized protein n=1 Tax=Arachidicoccus rhizosphaerae TaxID=551991 RepID=A0A1H3Z3Z9_9BACT|nr:hypothetical protein [Arachidicoccus rhizosphaerae]SEA18445.1 hypothetical protein SAMN05192529_1106 [Arachidicoccus rhizosphaerae]